MVGTPVLVLPPPLAQLARGSQQAALTSTHAGVMGEARGSRSTPQRGSTFDAAAGKHKTRVQYNKYNACSITPGLCTCQALLPGSPAADHFVSADTPGASCIGRWGGSPPPHANARECMQQLACNSALTCWRGLADDRGRASPCPPQSDSRGTSSSCSQDPAAPAPPPTLLPPRPPRRSLPPSLSSLMAPPKPPLLLLLVLPPPPRPMLPPPPPTPRSPAAAWDPLPPGSLPHLARPDTPRLVLVLLSWPMSTST